MLALLIFHAFMGEAETRVYCRDPNAQPWVPLGKSCPVTCGHVITAVEKLAAIDYKKLILYNKFFNNNLNTSDKNKTNENEITTNDIKTTENDETIYKLDDRKNIVPDDTIRIYRKYYNILSNEDVRRDLKMEYKRAMNFKVCFRKDIVEISKICAEMRRSYEEDAFLKHFTAILNKYSDIEVFTEELTGMILEQILGKNVYLRYNVFDVSKLLFILNSKIKKNEQKINLNQSITLKSRHCLYLHIPGCFCKKGFVERSAQCVMPSDCFNGRVESNILARIIIH